MLDYIFQNFLPQMFKGGGHKYILSKIWKQWPCCFYVEGVELGAFAGWGGVSAEAPGEVVDYVLFCYGRDPLIGLEPRLGLQSFHLPLELFDFPDT